MSHSTKTNFHHACLRAGITESTIDLPTGWQNWLAEISDDHYVAKFIFTMDQTKEDVTRAMSMIRVAMPKPTQPMPITPPQTIVTGSPTISSAVPALPTFTPPTDSKPEKPPAEPAVKKPADAESKPEVKVEPKQQPAAPAMSPAKAVPPAPTQKPAPSAPAPSGGAPANHWFTSTGIWASRIGIGLLVLLIASVGMDLFAANVSNSIVSSLNPPQSIVRYTGPFWSSVLSGVSWATLARWLIGITSAMLVFQLLVILDVLNNFTGADWPGLAGQGMILISPMILNPIWTLGTLWAGLILIRRDRDAKQGAGAALAWVGAITFVIDILGRTYQSMPTGLTSTILKYVGSWLYSLTPETVWYAAYPSLILFLLSYVKTKNVDSDGMAGAILALATSVAITSSVPYMAGKTVSGLAYTVVVTVLGLIALFLAYRETSSKLTKPFIGFVVTIAYWGSVFGLSSIFEYALQSWKGWNVGILWTSAISATVLGLCVALTQWGQAASSDAEGKTTYKVIQTVWGDAVIWYFLFYPAAYQVYIIILWLYSLLTKTPLI